MHAFCDMSCVHKAGEFADGIRRTDRGQPPQRREQHRPAHARGQGAVAPQCAAPRACRRAYSARGRGPRRFPPLQRSDAAGARSGRRGGGRARRPHRARQLAPAPGVADRGRRDQRGSDPQRARARARGDARARAGGIAGEPARAAQRPETVGAAADPRLHRLRRGAQPHERADRGSGHVARRRAAAGRARAAKTGYPGLARAAHDRSLALRSRDRARPPPRHHRARAPPGPPPRGGSACARSRHAADTPAAPRKSQIRGTNPICGRRRRALKTRKTRPRRRNPPPQPSPSMGEGVLREI